MRCMICYLVPFVVLQTSPCTGHSARDRMECLLQCLFQWTGSRLASKLGVGHLAADTSFGVSCGAFQDFLPSHLWVHARRDGGGHVLLFSKNPGIWVATHQHHFRRERQPCSLLRTSNVHSPAANDARIIIDSGCFKVHQR